MDVLGKSFIGKQYSICSEECWAFFIQMRNEAAVEYVTKLKLSFTKNDGIKLIYKIIIILSINGNSEKKYSLKNNAHSGHNHCLVFVLFNSIEKIQQK